MFCILLFAAKEKDSTTQNTNVSTMKQKQPFSEQGASGQKELHIETPLIESHVLSPLAGIPVYLKMDCLQPVSSFKIRGIGHFCQKVWYFIIYSTNSSCMFNII